MYQLHLDLIKKVRQLKGLSNIAVLMVAEIDETKFFEGFIPETNPPPKRQFDVLGKKWFASRLLFMKKSREVNEIWKDWW